MFCFSSVVMPCLFFIFSSESTFFVAAFVGGSGSSSSSRSLLLPVCPSFTMRSWNQKCYAISYSSNSNNYFNVFPTSLSSSGIHHTQQWMIDRGRNDMMYADEDDYDYYYYDDEEQEYDIMPETKTSPISVNNNNDYRANPRVVMDDIEEEDYDYSLPLNTKQQNFNSRRAQASAQEANARARVRRKIQERKVRTNVDDFDDNLIKNDPSRNRVKRKIRPNDNNIGPTRKKKKRRIDKKVRSSVDDFDDKFRNNYNSNPNRRRKINSRKRGRVGLNDFDDIEDDFDGAYEVNRNPMIDAISNTVGQVYDNAVQFAHEFEKEMEMLEAVENENNRRAYINNKRKERIPRTTKYNIEDFGLDEKAPTSLGSNGINGSRRRSRGPPPSQNNKNNNGASYYEDDDDIDDWFYGNDVVNNNRQNRNSSRQQQYAEYENPIGEFFGDILENIQEKLDDGGERQRLADEYDERIGIKRRRNRNMGTRNDNYSESYYDNDLEGEDDDDDQVRDVLAAKYVKESSSSKTTTNNNNNNSNNGTNKTSENKTKTQTGTGPNLGWRKSEIDLSWQERADQYDRVPPSGVKAWGPMGEVRDAATVTKDGIVDVNQTPDAKEYAATMARKDLRELEQKVEEFKGLKVEAEEKLLLQQA